MRVCPYGLIRSSIAVTQPDTCAAIQVAQMELDKASIAAECGRWQDGPPAHIHLDVLQPEAEAHAGESMPALTHTTSWFLMTPSRACTHAIGS